MLVRLNEEIKRGTRVVRIFSSAESCLRLVRALCGETLEARLEDSPSLVQDSTACPVWSRPSRSNAMSMASQAGCCIWTSRSSSASSAI